MYAMVQSLLGMLILMGIYRLLRSKIDHDIDWFTALAFMLAPNFCLFMLGLMIKVASLPSEILLLGYGFYVLIPYMILHKGLHLQPKISAVLTTPVLLVGIFTEMLLLNGI